MGESGLDTGGPSREFWRLLMTAFKTEYCYSAEGGCFLCKNVPAMQVCPCMNNINYTKLLIAVCG